MLYVSAVVKSFIWIPSGYFQSTVPLMLLVGWGQVWALIPEPSGALLVCLVQALLDNTETSVVSHTTDSSKPYYCCVFLSGYAWTWISGTNLKGSFPQPHPVWKPPSTTAVWERVPISAFMCFLQGDKGALSRDLPHVLPFTVKELSLLNQTAHFICQNTE